MFAELRCQRTQRYSRYLHLLEQRRVSRTMLLYIKQKCLQRSLQAAQQGQSNTGHLWVGWMHAGLHFFLNSKVTNSSNWFVFLKKLFILYREACSSDGKASAYNAGNLGSIPGSGSSPGEGNGNPDFPHCRQTLYRLSYTPPYTK